MESAPMRNSTVVWGIFFESPPSLPRSVVPVWCSTAPAARNSRPLKRVWFIAWKSPAETPSAVERPTAVRT